jgi:hypothetical protein
MLVTATATLPLWASIMIAVVPLVISAMALIGGWRQQTASRAQQATEHTANLKQQEVQLTATLGQQRDQQAQMLEHQRRQDDLRETRGVLDDAARALHSADHRRRAMINDLDNQGKREALRVAGLALDEIKERLAIRFGREQIVTTTFADCADAIVGVFGATQFAELSTLPERANRLEAAGRDFEARWPSFIDAATACAGVELPARER